MGFMSGPLFSLGYSAFSAASNAYSGYRKTRDADEALAVNSLLAEQNAAVLDVQAEDAIRMAGAEVLFIGGQTGEEAGRSRAAYAAGGITVDTGSGAAVQADIAARGKLREEMRILQGEKDAWLIRARAAETRRSAMARAMTNSPLAAASSSLISSLPELGRSYGAADAYFKSKAL